MDKYIKAVNLRNTMYQETFEKDSEMQKWESGCWIRYKLFENVLDAMPSADVRENIHGMWEERFDYTHEKFCSRCGIPQLWMNAVVYNYCPNCGADMRERKDAE